MCGECLQALALAGAVEIRRHERYIAAIEMGLRGELCRNGCLARAVRADQQERGFRFSVHRLDLHALVEGCREREAQVAKPTLCSFTRKRFGERRRDAMLPKKANQCRAFKGCTWRRGRIDFT